MKRIPVKKTIIVLFFLFLIAPENSYASPIDYSGEWHRTDLTSPQGIKIVQDNANVAVLNMDAVGTDRCVRRGLVNYRNVLLIGPFDGDPLYFLTCILTQPDQMQCKRVGDGDENTEFYSRIKKY